jgi:hypothetical protein
MKPHVPIAFRLKRLDRGPVRILRVYHQRFDSYAYLYGETRVIYVHE